MLEEERVMDIGYSSMHDTWEAKWWGEMRA